MVADTTFGGGIPRGIDAAEMRHQEHNMLNVPLDDEARQAARSSGRALGTCCG